MSLPRPPPLYEPTTTPRPPPPRPPVSNYSGRPKKKRGARENWKQPREPSFLRKYGLLRNVVARIPSWACHLKIFLVHLLHLLVHLAQLTTVTLEANSVIAGSTVILSKDGGSAKMNALRLLVALVYDGALGLITAVLTIAWALRLPCPGDGTMAAFRRLAVLQAGAASVLHHSSVARFRKRSSKYNVPPLFLMLAYLVVPWIGLSVWLVELQEGEHLLGGSVASDVGLMALIFSGRAILFGRYGLTRMPRGPRALQDWAMDALVLVVIVAAFDWLVLRSAWLERRRNWKYVLCAVNLIWPFFVWRELLTAFREENPEKAPKDEIGTSQQQLRQLPPASNVKVAKERGRGGRGDGSNQRRRSTSRPGMVRQRPRQTGAVADDEVARSGANADVEYDGSDTDGEKVADEQKGGGSKELMAASTELKKEEPSLMTFTERREFFNKKLTRNTLDAAQQELARIAAEEEEEGSSEDR